MQISPGLDRYLHRCLPIDEDEKILNVYRHHWFVYVASWGVGILVAILVMGAAVALTLFAGSSSSLVGHEGQILAGAGIFSLLILGGSYIPVYLRAQEQLVLTEEALLQMLQPSLFASKTDHVGLQQIADVSVHRDFLGTILGYGHLTIETPGEQDNLEFDMLGNPEAVAREIMHAQENFIAALESGRLPTTFGGTPAGGTGGGQGPTVAIDPKQYEQFLAFQRMMAQQQQDAQRVNGQSGDNDHRDGNG